MSRYDVLLCDADETLLDFAQAERNAFCEACQGMHIPAGERELARYSAINLACWKRFERGELTQPQLRVPEFLRTLGSGADAEALARDYEEALSHQGCALPGAAEAVQRWQRRIRVVVVTNGIAAAQRGRFSRSPFPELLEDIVISQEAGVAKPDPRMVLIGMARAGVADPARALMLGDSLTSDMQAAVNAGVDACWYNPKGKPNEMRLPIRYEVHSLDEVDGLL